MEAEDEASGQVSPVIAQPVAVSASVEVVDLTVSENEDAVAEEEDEVIVISHNPVELLEDKSTRRVQITGNSSAGTMPSGKYKMYFINVKVL